MNTYPFKVVCNLYSEPAFYINLPTLEVIKASPMRSEDVFLLDGTNPVYGSDMRCGACGEIIYKPFTIVPNES